MYAGQTIFRGNGFSPLLALRTFKTFFIFSINVMILI